METPANETTFKNYLAFFAGQQASLLGSSVAQFVIIWWITIITESTMYLSIAAFLGLTPIIILSPVTGVFADRWNRKLLLGVVDFLQALTALGVIFLFWAGTVSVFHIFVVLALRGVFQAFHMPTVSAITPLMVPQDKLSRINGLSYLLNGVMTIIGPVLAALLLAFWQIYQVLWIDVATFLIALVPLLLIRIPPVKIGREKSSFRKEFTEGFGFIKNGKGFMTLLMLATVLNFLLTPLFTLFSYFVMIDHAGTAQEFAFVSAFVNGGILAGGLLMSVTKGFKDKMVATALSIYVIFVGYALIALTPMGMFWFMALGGLIMAVCLPIANVSTQTIVQTVVPLEMQGRVNAVTIGLASAAQPFGMILAGIIAGTIGTANLFLACALLGIIAMTGAWFLTDVKYVDKLKNPNATVNNPQAE